MANITDSLSNKRYGGIVCPLIKSFCKPLRKHAYSNILKILQQKKPELFQIKILIFFLFLLKNIDCGTR